MADQLAKSLVDAAMELHRRRPWARVPADAPILLHVPDEPHPVVATIHGPDRSDNGSLLLVPGKIVVLAEGLEQSRHDWSELER